MMRIRVDAEDYVEKNCTVNELIRLYGLAGIGMLVPRENDKPLMAMSLCELVTPMALIAAWDAVLVERADQKLARQQLNCPGLFVRLTLFPGHPDGQCEAGARGCSGGSEGEELYAEVSV